MTREADIPYAEALRELEEIVSRIERDNLDVDRLVEDVRRAAELIRVCRRRLDQATVEIEQIVADIESEIDQPRLEVAASSRARNTHGAEEGFSDEEIAETDYVSGECEEGEEEGEWS
ncbi:MAG: hypothetical protein KatS3mg008_1276 [Acidimicrobiales bacterium]|nr:MAG: hypothetical protein KatS3mg008_1276 [Acidimicrobiales bacterium]